LTKGGIAMAGQPNSSYICIRRWQQQTDGLVAICSCKLWLWPQL